MTGYEVLYIHPYFHENYRYVPYGAIGIMNSIKKEKRGLYYFEARKEHIRSAKVILIDVHWLYAVEFSRYLFRAIKQINPAAVLIVGGISSNTYKEFLVKNGADFVILGDSTLPARDLVDAILSGKSEDYILENIANVYSARGRSQKTYRLTSDDFGKINYLDIDWFSTYEGVVGTFQKRQKSNFMRGTFMFPNVFFYQGCKYDCKTCDGSSSSCERLYGRNIILKKPQDIKREIERIEEKGYGTFCTFNDPFMVFSENDLRSIFYRKFDLNFIGGDIYSVPNRDIFSHVKDAFNKYYFSLVVRDEELGTEQVGLKLEYFKSLGDKFEKNILEGKLRIGIFHSQKIALESLNMKVPFGNLNSSNWNLNKPDACETDPSVLEKHRIYFFRLALFLMIERYFGIKDKDFSGMDGFCIRYSHEGRTIESPCRAGFCLNGILLEFDPPEESIDRFYLAYNGLTLRPGKGFINNGKWHILMNDLGFMQV